MAVKQSEVGKRRQPVPTSHVSGVRVIQMVSYTATESAIATTDKVELGILPARAQLVGIDLIGAGFGAITAKVGLMSGVVGAPDDARTVGSEFWAAQSVNDAEARLTKAAALAIAPAEADRSIGAQFSALVAVGAGKTLTLLIEYTF